MGRSNITLYQADCMDMLPQVPDNYYQLCIVDPPYGIGNFTQSDRKQKYKNYGEYTWNVQIPNKEYFQELKRVSGNQIIWGANYYNCFTGGAAIIWDKKNPHPNMSRCEIASVSWGKRTVMIEIMHFGAHQDKGNFHPCAKPIRLYRWILQNYAKEGDKILDTHLGSGSIAIACWDMRYDLEAYEIDKEYYEKACSRFDMHCKQGQLF